MLKSIAKFDCNLHSSYFRTDFKKFLYRNHIKFKISNRGMEFEIFDKSDVNLILLKYDQHFQQFGRCYSKYFECIDEELEAKLNRFEIEFKRIK